MSTTTFLWNRCGLIARLAAIAPEGKFGRTALMKHAYFLQTLRNVPLHYHFSLYTYGPFDSAVLDDLSYAESLGAVKAKVIYYPSGYGYDIQVGENAQLAQERSSDFLAKYENDIQWVIRAFGSLGPAELELVSTIIYADREAASASGTLSQQELARRVGEIKPRFSLERINEQISRMKTERLLTATH